MSYTLDTHFQPIFDLPTAEHGILLEWLQYGFWDTLYWMPAEYDETDLYWTSSSRASDPVVTEFEISRINGATFVLANFSDSRHPEYYLENAATLHQRLLLYYEEKTSLRSRLCPANWFGSRLFDYAVCFRITIIDSQILQPTDNLQNFCNQGRVFVIDSAQKTHVFQELSSIIDDDSEQHYCLFNFDQTNDFPITAEIWEEASDRLKYVNWADNWRSDDGFLMLDSRTGKWLFRNSFSCVVCEMDGPSETIVPALHFIENENAFSLTISPVEIAWGTGFLNPDIQCIESRPDYSRKHFAITIQEIQRLPLPNGYSESKFSIQPKIWNTQPAYYKCKIHSVSSYFLSNLVTSQRMKLSQLLLEQTAQIAIISRENTLWKCLRQLEHQIWILLLLVMQK